MDCSAPFAEWYSSSCSLREGMRSVGGGFERVQRVNSFQSTGIRTSNNCKRARTSAAVSPNAARDSPSPLPLLQLFLKSRSSRPRLSPRRKKRTARALGTWRVWVWM